jgi:hypothetical protein
MPSFKIFSKPPNVGVHSAGTCLITPVDGRFETESHRRIEKPCQNEMSHSTFTDPTSIDGRSGVLYAVATCPLAVSPARGHG